MASQKPKSFVSKILGESHNVLKDKKNSKEPTRNINSFKMKGMGSISGDMISGDAVKLFVEQHLDTEVIEDGFMLPKKHLR